jgi:catechol 2,3-dioxygenase-like lactoylglutathione lyase family enzyme
MIRQKKGNDMTISCLHHINIQTDKLEETREFYEKVLGLYVGARPDFGNVGYWLFAQSSEQPIVHLSLRTDDGPDQTNDKGNRLDHVAFFGKDLDETLAQLKKLKVKHDVMPDRLYLDTKMVQVFLKDPNGITVELGFFPQRDAMFNKSMAEYQAAARKGDKKLKSKNKPKAKARATMKPKAKAKKTARAKVPA